MGWLKKIAAKNPGLWDIDWPYMQRYMRRHFRNEDSMQHLWETFYEDAVHEGRTQQEARKIATEAMWQWTQNLFENAHDSLTYRLPPEGNELEIYRVVMAPNIDAIKLDSVGIFWARDKEAAEAHWGDYSRGNRHYMITAIVDPQYVDWRLSLALNSMDTQSDEKEIRLFEGSPVKIIKIESWGWHPNLPSEFRDINQIGKAMEMA